MRVARDIDDQEDDDVGFGGLLKQCLACETKNADTDEDPYLLSEISPSHDRAPHRSRL